MVVLVLFWGVFGGLFERRFCSVFFFLKVQLFLGRFSQVSGAFLVGFGMVFGRVFEGECFTVL